MVFTLKTWSIIPRKRQMEERRGNMRVKNMALNLVPTTKSSR
jgi:hypothetical protein